jgi:hypothetical protein
MPFAAAVNLPGADGGVVSAAAWVVAAEVFV